MGKVILIASGKGGVGKTVFTANAGAALAQKGYKVVLIDMDMGLRNLDLCLGLENKVVYDIADALTGLCRIKQALIRDRRFEELYFISAAHHRDKGDLTPLHMQVLCEKLKARFDYVLVDAPSGIGDGLKMAAAGADTGVIITTPEHVAVRDADTLDRILQGMNIKERMYIVNKVKADLMNLGVVPNISEINDMLKMPMTGIIQYDDNIHIAANNGIPVVLKKGTYIAENFSHIVERMVEIKP
ncbi:septum site-determining protein MinD [Aminipila butyrica]|uniref:Septum site-determining protein MinD n=1 Tax=Aminipila butyrica TaxID=433296 RepID=A0A858BXG6_9FIRM|nr:septum site-determining protein MinD [Aminipila butyrica]QIB69869.1 septum site-determining protein MinD [Aminipila butyrica]